MLADLSATMVAAGSVLATTAAAGSALATTATAVMSVAKPECRQPTDAC